MKYFRFLFLFFLIQRMLWSEEFVVNSLADAGAGSLREALTVIQDYDIITFDTGLLGTILLLSPLPIIDANNIKIFGPPSQGVNISGNALHPVFQVNGQGILIRDLNVLAAAIVGSGAGLLIGNSAIVTFLNGSFNNCVATGAAGGAIHVGDNASLKMIDTTFSNNTSGGPGDDIFLGTSSSVMYTASSTIPSIEVFGIGQFVKGGTGTTTVTIPASTAIDLVAQAGNTISTGVRTAPTIILHGARLEGEQTSLYIANHGTFKPSESIGISITTGDYHQVFNKVSNGTLEIAITPGTNDLLTVGGNAYVDGTLFIDPSDGNYSIGTFYTIMTTGGNISGKFKTVTSSSMKFTVHYFPQSIQIEIVEL